MSDKFAWFLAAFIGAAILILLGCKFFPRLKRHMKELRYINKEIQRTTGGERQRWIRRKRKLLWSWLPFVKIK